MSTPLHPNLARLAAAYDEIFSRYSRNQIDAAQARMEISALVGRDDEGILWSIDPDSGGWLRRTIAGDLVPDTPPAYGLATPTPHDVSNGSTAFNPDHQLHMSRVDDELLYSPSALSGSTRHNRKVVQVHRDRRWLYVAVGAVVAVAAVFAILRLVGSGEDQAPGPGAPTTSVPTSLPS